MPPRLEEDEVLLRDLDLVWLCHVLVDQVDLLHERRIRIGPVRVSHDRNNILPPAGHLEEVLHRPGRKLNRIDGLDIIGDMRDRRPVRRTQVEHPHPGGEVQPAAEQVVRGELAPVGVPDPVALKHPLPVDPALTGGDQDVPEPDHATTPAASIRAWASSMNSGTRTPR